MTCSEVHTVPTHRLHHDRRRPTTPLLWSTMMGLSLLAPMASLHPQSPVPQSLLDCWVFELVESPSPAQPTTMTPAVARLTEDSARFTGGAIVRRLDERGRWLDSLMRGVISNWRLTPDGDSVTVVFSVGFARSVYVLAWRPRAASSGRFTERDTLTGRALEWFDYGPLTVPRGAARARRRACPG
jgi:hypothetical protein